MSPKYTSGTILGRQGRCRIEFLATVPADEFDKDRGIRFKRYKVTIARLIEAEADDEREHSEQITEFARGSSAEK